MNNYEKIKAMSIDEMAEFLDTKEKGSNDYCYNCPYNGKSCYEYSCKEGIKLWLESEEE